MKKYLIYIVLCMPLLSMGQLVLITTCEDDSGAEAYRYWRDADGDGYGNPSISTCSAISLSGYIRASTGRKDCNDSDASVNQAKTWYRDADGDGWGTSSITKSSCNKPSGYIARAGDCNDNNASVYQPRTWYRDADGDGRGTSGVSTNSCNQPSGYVASNGDCNDNDPNIRPGISEGCSADGKDNNCNGEIDETIPATPTATITNNCGSTILTQGIHPIGGPITWYWQSSATGTSTSNSAASITRTSGSVYYLRSKNSNTGCWSAARTINYSVKSVPGTPTAPSVSNQCDKSVLTRGNPPSGVTWYWQSGSTGTSTSNSSTSITRTSGSVYYLRARNNSSGCWGGVRTVNYSINPLPAMPAAPTVSNQCGKSVLTMGSSPNGVNWHWQSSPSGTDSTLPLLSITRTSGSVYYLRARNMTTGCWSTARTVNYSIIPLPAIPTAPSITNECGKTIITATNPPNGIEWHWQSSPTGTGRGTFNTTQIRTSGNVVYLRARNDATGCWSDARTVNYTVNTLPTAPTAPTIVNNCGATTLTQDTPPNGITWYWQSSATGTSTTNTSASINKTSGTTYYLRGKNNSSECWGTTTVITYTIDPIPNWYKDADGDGFASSKINQCESPGVGYTQTVLPLTDCNDADASLNPNTVWYADADNDTWGNPGVFINQCNQPIGYVRNADDYDDSTDRITNIEPRIFYTDTDGDGFGDPKSGIFYSVQPTGYVLNRGDKCPDEYGEIQGCMYDPYDQINFSNKNYVFSRAYQEPMTSPEFIRHNKDVIENITYYDGLGRSMQQKAIKASTAQNDIVTHIGYDAFGRQAKQHLPFEEVNGVTGSYREVNINDNINVYYQNKYPDDFTGMILEEVNAYSETVFEPSPLNRVQEQGAPGAAWKAIDTLNTDHTIKFDWNTNSANEVIHLAVTFENNDTKKPQLIRNGNYATNQLYVSITKDENWQPGQTHPNDHTIREYTNKLGRMILKRTFNENVAHDTYYVYDGFGNLTYVIPPKVTTTDGISDTELAELCYQYRYDYRNRLIEKKIPSKGNANTWESIVYNKLDQPILTQDPNQKAKNEWLFTKYDAFGRVAYTGTLTDNRERKAIQTEVNTYTNDLWVEIANATLVGGTTMYYTNGGYPNTQNAEVLTINYYDDYTFLDNTPAPQLGNPGIVYNEPVSNNTKSLATGSKVKVLGTNQWITTVTYYDKKARPICIATTNEYLNTSDIVETKLDFIGKVEETTTRHNKTGQAEIKTIDVFTYDHMGRLLTQTQKINNQDTEQIITNQYDELGQLISKKVGSGVLSGAEGLQTVDYNYNIRGWLKSINNGSTANGDLFGFAIDYNTGANPLYNGNISSTSWQTANDNIMRSYDYTYDALNRITNGISSDGKFDLSSVSYDKMGNILTLSRTGAIVENPDIAKSEHFGIMDNLGYTYDSGNKLFQVTDIGNDTFGFKDVVNTGNDYSYDINGNMTVDQNKGITGITYNHLNLPTTVSISNTEGTGNISYIYDATGAKLKKIAPSGGSFTETEYAGNYVYRNGTLEFFNHPEGIVEKEADGYKYVYQFKDHLGNVRLSYKDADKNGSISQSEIVQEKNYYPFGLQHKGYNTAVNGRNHNYGFGGKEEQDEIGLEWLDFDARNYDASLGRWFVIDALADEPEQVFMSPYQYSWNNPIYYTDPDGNCPKCWEAIKDYYGGIATGISSKASSVKEGLGNLISNPARTVVGAAKSHVEMISNPVALVGEVLETVGDVNPAVGLAQDVVESSLSDNPAQALGETQGENVASDVVDVSTVAAGAVGSKLLKVGAKSAPKEAYNRRKHYGNTPTQADRKALGAKKGQDVDHTTPLVKHYYEQGGHKMTPKQRKAFAKNRSNMNVRSQRANRSDGGRLSQYSKNMKKKYGLNKLKK